MVEAVFDDVLTDFNCAALITELTKFILYSKQQIPFSYDKLYSVVKQRSKQKKKIGILSGSERLFRDAQNSVNTLEELFLQITDELSRSDRGTISEVALILGGAISTAKQAFRIHVPAISFGHLQRHHSDRALMAQVLQTIVNSDSLHEILKKPLQPTNMFVLIRKQNNGSHESWLVPEPKYKFPIACQQFHFKFEARKASDASCCCKGFKFFSDTSADNISIPTEEAVEEEVVPDLWYKAPLAVKGFKDVFVKGVSVSKDWFVAENKVCSS